MRRNVGQAFDILKLRIFPKLLQQRLRRFFVEEEGGYRVAKPLREMVVFARQNLISDPPFSRMDFISCRNLMIYLEPDLQKKLLPTFHYALKPAGFLFLGASESVGGFTELFELGDRKHKIYARKAAPTPAFHPPMKREEQGKRRPSPLLARAAKAEAPEGLQRELNAQREADRVTLSQFAPPGVLAFANDSFYKTFKVSPGESEGCLIYDLGNGQWNIPRLRELLEDILSRHSCFSEFEVMHELEGIGRRTLLLNARKLEEAAGNPERILLGIHEITDRKQMEAARSRLASLVESSSDAIISKDLDGVTTTWNAGAGQLFGYTAQEAIGRSVTMLLPLDRLHEEREFLARIKRGESVDHFATIRVRKDGSHLEISLTISPIRDALGQVIGAFKVARDITQRRRMEAELLEWQRCLEARVAKLNA